MEPLDDCRICGDKAQYNLFTDELHFDSKNVKIYIVLNNFLFEKVNIYLNNLFSYNCHNFSSTPTMNFRLPFVQTVALACRTLTIS